MASKNAHTIFNEEGHLDENSIALCSEWLIGRIGSIDEDILDHLQKCPKCKSDALEISEIISLDKSSLNAGSTERDKFEETCAAKYSPSIKPDTKMNFWRVAAVLAVLLTVTALTILLKPGGKGDGGNSIVKLDSPAVIKPGYDTTGKDTVDYGTRDTAGSGVVVESVEKDRYAENYNENPALEALVGTRFRSGNKPSVQSPPEDTTIMAGEELLFMWSNKNNEDLELQILDNTGKQVETYTNAGLEDLLITFDLTPGLYYWKLLGKEELYQVGKISVSSKGQPGLN
jgi:hypothetical protein